MEWVGGGGTDEDENTTSSSVASTSDVDVTFSSRIGGGIFFILLQLLAWDRGGSSCVREGAFFL